MNFYSAPEACTVDFETVDIIATSEVPELLKTWGENISDVDSVKTDLFK